MKTLGYYIFAIVYYLCKPIPFKKNRVLCIASHDDRKGSNVNLVRAALEEKDSAYSFSSISKSQIRKVKEFSSIKALLSFFIKKPYQMARAEIILMDNVFLPMAFLRVKKHTKVVQLWHGTGTIKKFGQDVNTGRLGKLEKRANENISHLIVNSQEMKDLYAGAFGISKNRIYPIGLPKTDLMYYHMKNDLHKASIYDKYSIPQDKKLILYAPTFRDYQESDNQVGKDLRDIVRQMALEIPEEYYLGVRLHPFIANDFLENEPTSINDKRIINMSFEEEGPLLVASDILITDYSSIIFEYSIMERPMIFYAYDLETYKNHDRGFYYDYESYVPGPLVRTSQELGQIFVTENYPMDKVKEFKEKNFPYLDGKAIERLLELICVF